MKDTVSNEGVHPNRTGYEQMRTAGDAVCVDIEGVGLLVNHVVDEI
jgi:hypothetical protein